MIPSGPGKAGGGSDRLMRKKGCRWSEVAGVAGGGCRWLEVLGGGFGGHAIV